MTVLRHAEGLRHVRAPSPVRFPSEALVPETKEHLLLRTALFQVLSNALGDRAIIGSDQFVYWDASDARQGVAPDLFVKLGSPDETFDSWMVWKRGAPDFALEILSESDAPRWAEKLPRYAALGVDELVTYRLRDGALRVWDRLDGDLVERIVDGPSTPLRTLGIHLLSPRGATTLAFAEDEEGTRPLLSRDAARAARLRAKLVAAGIDPEGD